MEKLFIAVKPYCESEKEIMKLGGQLKEKMGVLLGDIVGYEANFYEISGMTRDEVNGVAARLIEACERNPSGELFRVTRAGDSYSMMDFVRHAAND